METITCPLCGFRFDPREQTACPSCPLHQNCTMVCCPACGHTTIDASRSALARWATRLFTAEKSYGTASGKKNDPAGDPSK